MYRNYGGIDYVIDISDNYDQHQDIFLNDNSKGLSKMSIDNTKVIIRKLASQGETFSMSIFRSLRQLTIERLWTLFKFIKKTQL